MLKKLNKLIVANKYLLVILGIAFIFRVIGINHGFPFIFHPDEPTVVRSALEVRFYPNPKHFDWPHFYIYLNFVLYMAFSILRNILAGIGLKDALTSILPILWDDKLIFYLLTRLFGATLGALTVIPVYLTGKNLFNKRVGLYSALCFALIPYHVLQSHYTLIDVPMLFWLSWGLYFSSRILVQKSEKILDYALAGLFVGFSASTKYNGGLSSLMVFAAHVINLYQGILDTNVGTIRIRQLIALIKKLLSFTSIKCLVISGVLAVFGFFIGTPYAFLDFDTFSRTDGPKGAFWQFTNVGKVDTQGQLKNLLYAFTVRLPDDFGYTLLIAYFMTVVLFIMSIFHYQIVSRLKLNLKSLTFLITISMFLFLYISGFEKTRSHYYLITYSFVAILSGYFIYKLVELTSNYSMRIRRLLVSIVLIVFFGVPFCLGISRDLTLLESDSRLELYTWLKEQGVPSNNLVYDGNDLKLIFEPFTDFITTNSKNIKLSEAHETSGYLIVSCGAGTQPKATFYHEKVYSKLQEQFSQVHVIYSHNNKGPDIYIYSLKPYESN